MDLQNISSFPEQPFDLVFSSNALEHVPDVPLFFRHAWRLLRPDGSLVIAVPPIFNEESRKSNEMNLYHLNIWSPKQWHHVLKQFFSEVECYRHHFEKPGVALNFANAPEQTIITEKDFLFLPISLEQLCEVGALTAIFVARKPLGEGKIPSIGESIRFVDESYTRPPPATGRDPSSLLRAGWDFGRQHGILALTRKVYGFLQTQARGSRYLR
jgi:hypothetical protein